MIDAIAITLLVLTLLGATLTFLLILVIAVFLIAGDRDTAEYLFDWLLYTALLFVIPLCIIIILAFRLGT